MVNCIWLSPGLYFVNINVYAKFHQNILYGSRDWTRFTLDLGKALTNYKCIWQPFLLDLVNINVYAKMQFALISTYEPPHDKANKMTVRPAKTQITQSDQSLRCALSG